MEKKSEIPGLIMQDTTHTITVDNPGRLDKFITAQFPLYSRTFFQHLISNEMVKVNGATVKKPSTPLATNDVVEISFPRKQKREIIATEVNKLGIEIIFEHPHFFIVYKPAGILMHPCPTDTLTPTFMDWLLTNHQELAQVGPIDRPGIVHRLDKDTSGILIVPRTNYAHSVFGKMFKDRHIQKTYLAVVEGHPTPAQGTISYAIGRHPVIRAKMAAFPTSSTQRVGGGVARWEQTPSTVRSATTHYTVERMFAHHALVVAKPVTGRTHQIRVHFAAIGHPLIGDAIYGSESHLIARHALHAMSLSFTFDGVPYHFEKEAPEDFKNLLHQLTIIHH